MKQKTEKTESIRVMILDDEKDGAELLESLLRNLKNIEVIGIANEADKGIEMALFHKPDILFLDIHMPGKNGFGVIEELNRYHFNPAVIFITAYDQYAIRAIKADALDYLLKPVSLKELKEAINRYLVSEKFSSVDTGGSSGLGTKTGKTLRINTRSGFHVIPIRDIIYIEAEGNYSNIFLGSGRKIIATLNLGKLLPELPENIIRISRAIAVNSEFITEIDRKHKICKISINGLDKSFGVSREHIREIDKLF